MRDVSVRASHVARHGRHARCPHALVRAGVGERVGPGHVSEPVPGNRAVQDEALARTPERAAVSVRGGELRGVDDLRWYQWELLGVYSKLYWILLRDVLLFCGVCARREDTGNDGTHSCGINHLG